MFDGIVLDAIKAVARKNHVAWPKLAAVVEVESNGVAFATVDGRQEPLILFEYHIFDRRIPAGLRARARQLGLAAARWGAIRYPRSQDARWDLLNRARRLDDNAALESTSWGVGQVMGFHWKMLGFSSPQAMVKLARASIEGQIALMVGYIKRTGLMDELKRGDWAGFARGYNGPGYRKNRYDTKMATAFRRYNGGAAPRLSSSGMLRLGSRGARVRELQALLVRAGHALIVDGDFGPATKAAVRAFQRSNHLIVDGVAGPETMTALAAFKQSAEERPGEVAAMCDPDVGVGVGGGAGGAVVIETTKQQIDQVAEQYGYALPEWVMAALTALSVALLLAGLGYAAYRFWQKRQTVEGDEHIEWAEAA